MDLRKIIFFSVPTAALLVMTSACAQESEGQCLHLDVKFTDTAVQEILVAELKAEGIDFRVDSDGRVVPIENEKCQLDAVVSRVESRYYPKYGLSIPYTESSKAFERALETSGINVSSAVLTDRIIFSFSTKGELQKAERILEQYQDKIRVEALQEALRGTAG